MTGGAPPPRLERNDLEGLHHYQTERLHFSKHFAHKNLEILYFI